MYYFNWNVDRRHIEYDEVLIFRWVKIYNIARSLIIDITDAASNAMVAQMTNLLWSRPLDFALSQQMTPLLAHQHAELHP